jgi:hypothetical protein
MSDETPDAGLSAFARSLAAVAPHPGRLDRDVLLFAAGRAAGARRGRVWQGCTAVLTLLCAGLGTTLVLRSPASVEVPRVVLVPAPAAKPSLPTADEPSLSPADSTLQAEWAAGMRLRNRVLREGVAALPSPPLAWSGPPERPLSDREVPEISALNRFARP